MSCSTFSTTSPACRTVTFIEPDDTVLTATSSGGADQSLDESGSTIIPLNTPEMRVYFVTPKAGTDYRFEYLYIDTLGQTTPGAIIPVVSEQLASSFVVELAGIPLLEGYILRWRVIVVSLTIGSLVDEPESLRVQILKNTREQTFSFVNPRSSTNYGFTELRVENLLDPISTQRVVYPQIGAKTLLDFTVGFSTIVTTDNYFLVARTP